MNKGNTQYAELCYSTMINDIDTLEKSVRDYPASSLARFLLLYHYKKNDHPRFDELARQTGVYLNNTHWIQYQLSQADSLNERETSNKEIEDVSTLPKHPIVTGAVENDFVNIENEERQLIEEKENISDVVNEPIMAATIEDDSLTNEGNKNENSDEVKEVPTITNQPVTTDMPENDLVNTENEEGNTIEAKDEEKDEEIISTITNQPVTTDVPENDLVNTENEEGNTFEAKDNPTEEEPIAFEPLHTVDYFASQGIKITREELEKDHLGKQVKSFTAWLKSMKRLHPGQVPEQNEVIEKIIQTSSDISNQNANVLTEAMAEVLVKQDKKQKAIEMYQKLSLINPSKSAYFAAKIESLKLT